VLASRVLADGTRLSEVESPRRTAQWHGGGRESERCHGVDRPIPVRHLPAFGREVRIEIRPKRYRCPPGGGGPTTTPHCPGYDPNCPPTTAFAQAVLKRLVHRPVAAVSRPLAQGVKAVEGLMDHRVAPVVDGTAVTALATLGLDAVALGTGHGHYVAVLWARDAADHTPGLAGLADRWQATVPGFLETIPDPVTATVRRVGIARWEGYAGAVAAARPTAQRVGDRVPVAVQYRHGVDDVRKPEGRRLKAGRPADQALPTAERRPLGRREWPSLPLAAHGQRVELVAQTPPVASAYSRRTALPAIFACTPDRATAHARIAACSAPVKASGLSCFDKFLNTWHNWKNGMLNYVEGGHSSGFVEGLNNKLTLLKRRCCGLHDPVEVFRRLWLDIEGPRLWA
jgi:transposase